MDAFDIKNDSEYFAQSVAYDDIVQNDYNLSVSIYIEAEGVLELSSEIDDSVTEIEA